MKNSSTKKMLFVLVLLLFCFGFIAATVTTLVCPIPPSGEGEGEEPTEGEAEEPPAEGEAEPEPEAPEEGEGELLGSASEGGRLYDKWWEELDVDAPTGDQPLWATQTTNTRTGADTWRCKECHGWDYRGAEGAYGPGSSHFTGFTGLLESTPEMTQEQLLTWLDGTANQDHDFSVIPEDARRSLVIFLKEGLVDVSPYINAETRAAIGGDDAHGETLFITCAACHGSDGRTINFGSEAEPEYVGTIADDNPWEFIHKVRAAQPGTEMPSAIDSGWSLQDVVDVLTYAQTLPTEAP